MMDLLEQALQSYYKTQEEVDLELVALAVEDMDTGSAAEILQDRIEHELRIEQGRYAHGFRLRELYAASTRLVNYLDSLEDRLELPAVDYNEERLRALVYMFQDFAQNSPLHRAISFGIYEMLIDPEYDMGIGDEFDGLRQNVLGTDHTGFRSIKNEHWGSAGDAAAWLTERGHGKKPKMPDILSYAQAARNRDRFRDDARTILDRYGLEPEEVNMIVERSYELVDAVFRAHQSASS